MSNLLAEIVINAVINFKDYDDSFIKSQFPFVPITDDTINLECECKKMGFFSMHFASYNYFMLDRYVISSINDKDET